ncbi:T9SS type A sorting domain-containing protein [Belliella kenyensis]|uniref:T9SS type A sorting domain-containing protein n=1 Tax=Belliella kenyensis TaxID=1472724 RepID=A0ABV8EHS7_9BACT|nr:T9SS type A sorting domain-containing protein [Belliella kenyensis]MCH7402711.1 T9SS type A sorting domain-containing protein [Belliella kenyensis]MDN3603741.1 T9SS type A sorting domain-containing protein [Belliella kenyensis]
MKSFLLILVCVLLLFPLFSEAQVRVLSERSEFIGKIGATQRKSIIIQNESNTKKEYVLRFLRGNVGTSQKVKICIGDQCFDPTKDLSKIRISLKPGELMTDLYLEFELGIVEVKGNFELHFANTENTKDIFIVESIYNVSNLENIQDKTNHKDISIGDVYPNPSSRVAHLDYDYKNKNATAKISINSFIGNPVAEYKLDPTQNTLVMNIEGLRPGVYFYTLFVENKNIVTKKLVVE